MRFGYDGRGFSGWARQPGRRTIEGEIHRGLRRFGIEAADAGVSVASRTDQGVSARANALALHSELSGPTLLRSLNGLSPEIFFSAARPISEEFRVRSATRRMYRYFDAWPVQHPDRRAEAARLIVGDVDVRSFGRGLPAETIVRRTVESVSDTRIPGGSLVEIRAPSFVWGMVRKIVGALREVDTGRLSLSKLRAALDGRARLTLPMADPEPLVLWEVEYDAPWVNLWRGPNRAQTHAFSQRRAELWTGSRVLDALLHKDVVSRGSEVDPP